MAVLAAVLLSTTAHAATFFTDAAAFAAASTGLTNGNFAGIAQPGGFAFQPSFTVAGVTFENVDGADFVISPEYFIPSYYDALPFYSGQNGLVTTISFAGATAFGMAFGSYGGSSGSVIFTLGDGSVFNGTFPAARGTAGFFGFTSTTPITSISVQHGGQVFDVVSFSTGSANAVPEPASWALLISGFGLVGAVARRRRLLQGA